MLNLEEGTKAVQLARETIHCFVEKKGKPQPAYTGVFTEQRGVFTTLHTVTDHALRGCIGIPHPVMPLQQAIVESAVSSTHDPRFPPLVSSELDHVILELTILTPPQIITVDNPKEYLNKIQIGRDGLIIEQSLRKGLLLPQVPVEQGWDVEEFLVHTCYKAGLPPDAWVDTQTKISRFSGQIFSETAPNGSIEEKQLNGL